jgi:hypothetical protein
MRKIIVASLLALTLQAAELKLGKPLKMKTSLPLAELVAKPEAYVGKALQVKGRITEVCQVMGCWIMLTDGKNAMMRIQMAEGEVSFPKGAAGRSAIAEGKLAKYDLSRDEALAMAKHAAEDAGRPFHPDSVKAPYVYYQIEGTGAILGD